MEDRSIDRAEGFEIPVIDLEGKHEDVVKAVAEACQMWGFFQAVNHGVPVSSIQGILQAAKEFFNMPDEEKERCNSLSSKYKGHIPDELSGLIFEQLMSYRAGSVPVPGRGTYWRDCLRLNHLVKQHNVWPEKPLSFKYVVAEYMEHARRLTHNLLRIISEGLGMDSESLSSKFGSEPRHFVLMNYYPPLDKAELDKGIPAHSDMSGITALLQDLVGGLEVCKNGQWIPVKPIENALVVNVGDQLEVLSNGECKSVNHRAQVNPLKERLSIVSFYGPAYDAKIGPLSELVSETKPALYRECITKDYIAHYFSRPLTGKSSLDYLKII